MGYAGGPAAEAPTAISPALAAGPVVESRKGREAAARAPPAAGAGRGDGPLQRVAPLTEGGGGGGAGAGGGAKEEEEEEEVGDGEWGKGSGVVVPAYSTAPRGERAGKGGGGEVGEVQEGGGKETRGVRTSVVLGIPTVPRPKGVNYLEQTLQAVLAQVEQEVRAGVALTSTHEAICTCVLVCNTLSHYHHMLS